MSGFYRSNYYGGGNARSYDPIPRGGLLEAHYCGLRARFGTWPKAFLDIVISSYGGRVPPRFNEIVTRLERERSWHVPEEPSGLPPTITVVDKRGNVIDRWRLPKEEWEQWEIAKLQKRR